MVSAGLSNYSSTYSIYKCTCTLYSITLRPSPKLVLIALQLCRIALPLMTVAECSQVVVPPHPSLPAPSGEVGLAADIVRLLLAKLAEYIVPDATEVSPASTYIYTLCT